jgi:hypothetical protein
VELDELEEALVSSLLLPSSRLIQPYAILLPVILLHTSPVGLFDENGY